MPDRPQDEELAEMLEPKLGTEATTALMNAIPTLDHIDARFDQVEAHLADHDRHFAGLEARFDQVEAHLAEHDARFDGIDTRFDGIDARFDGIDARFDGIDTRFDGIDTRFDGIDGEIAGIDTRFDGIDGEIAGLRVSVDRLQEVLDYRLTGLAHELTAVFRGELNATVTSQTRTTIFALVATMLTLCGFFLTAFAIR